MILSSILPSFSITDDIEENLLWGVHQWGEFLKKISDYLSTTPSAFNGGQLWETVVDIHGAIRGAAYALMLIFFFMSYFREYGSFAETKKPEIAIKLFFRYLLTKLAIDSSLSLMQLIIDSGCDILALITPLAKDLSADYQIPLEMLDALAELNIFQVWGVELIMLIGNLVIIALSFSILLTVLGRFFELFLMAAIAPIGLSFFAGKATSSQGVTFLRSFAGLCLQGVVIMIACVLYGRYLTSDIMLAEGQTAMGAVITFFVNLIFNMLILVSVVKGSDRIIRDKFGM